MVQEAFIQRIWVQLSDIPCFFPQKGLGAGDHVATKSSKIESTTQRKTTAGLHHETITDVESPLRVSDENADMLKEQVQ